MREMEQPVLASDGYVYEAAFLGRWLAQSPSSPMTRASLTAGVPLAAARRALRRAGGAAAEVE
jgi:hypothetical protein